VNSRNALCRLKIQFGRQDIEPPGAVLAVFTRNSIWPPPRDSTLRALAAKCLIRFSGRRLRTENWRLGAEDRLGKQSPESATGNRKSKI
jgi:hypothetical protein